MKRETTLIEAIAARHSVRRYKDVPIPEETANILLEKIREVNRTGNLNIQLVREEPEAFKGIFAYGRFSGVRNYFVIAGHKDATLDERAGYYGEQLVLLAQQLGLNTCWAGLSYRKISNTYTLDKDEKIVCYIALGYGETQGNSHKHKTPEEISNVSDSTPEWFRKGIEAVILAPTAVNQQKFRFEYIGPENGNAVPKVKAESTFSLIGYTDTDLGIAKFHFETGAGKENFEWAQ